MAEDAEVTVDVTSGDQPEATINVSMTGDGGDAEEKTFEITTAGGDTAGEMTFEVNTNADGGGKESEMTFDININTTDGEKTGGEMTLDINMNADDGEKTAGEEMTIEVNATGDDDGEDKTETTTTTEKTVEVTETSDGTVETTTTITTTTVTTEETESGEVKTTETVTSVTETEGDKPDDKKDDEAESKDDSAAAPKDDTSEPATLNVQLITASSDKPEGEETKEGDDKKEGDDEAKGEENKDEEPKAKEEKPKAKPKKEKEKPPPPKPPLYAGWVRNYGGIGGIPFFQKWQRTWLSLDNAGEMFHYYKNEPTDTGKPLIASGGFFSSFLVMASARNDEEMSFSSWPADADANQCFVVATPKSIYYFVAEDEEQKNKWLENINAAKAQFGKEDVVMSQRLQRKSSRKEKAKPKKSTDDGKAEEAEDKKEETGEDAEKKEEKTDEGEKKEEDTPADQANTTTAEITVETTADADKDDKQEEPATLEAATDKQDQPESA